MSSSFSMAVDLVQRVRRSVRLHSAILPWELIKIAWNELCLLSKRRRSEPGSLGGVKAVAIVVHYQLSLSTRQTFKPRWWQASARHSAWPWGRSITTHQNVIGWWHTSVKLLSNGRRRQLQWKAPLVRGAVTRYSAPPYKTKRFPSGIIL